MCVVCTCVHVCGLCAYPVSVVCPLGGGREGQVLFLTAETMDAIKTLLEPMRRSLREYGNIDRMGSYQIFW